MRTLKPRPVFASRFTLDRQTRTFTAEASDLGYRAGESPFGRVYPDACDEGLTVISDRSGREVVFAIDHEERDADGDLLWWVLEPVEGEGLAGYRVQIFND